jgi:ribonuclease HI
MRKDSPVETRPGEAVIWTDGACSGNPGPGGWAAIVIGSDGGDPVELSGGERQTTNNRMELTAALEGLRSPPDGSKVVVVTDSQLMLNSMTTWLPGWKRKGWKTAAGKPVANRELVVRIDELLDGRSVEFRYVPAHQVDGDPLNDFADRAASQAAVVQEPAGSEHGSPEPPKSPAAKKTAKSAGPPRKRTASSAVSSASSSSSRTLKAKFPGRCRCGRSYTAGETIAKNPDGWGHPECRTEA